MHQKIKAPKVHGCRETRNDYICRMQAFVDDFFGKDNILNVEVLPKAGSDRQYKRLITTTGSFILCHNSNQEENRSFQYFANLFSQHGLPVPRVLAMSSDFQSYIQDDLGPLDLLTVVQQQGHTEEVKALYKTCLHHLAQLQVVAGADVDFHQCYGNAEFDHYAIQADLNYFKYYFLDRVGISYDKVALAKEFEYLSTSISAIEPRQFMYRDFQGRNILIHQGQPYFIDFQGGMKGPIQYDAASLLWQAKAKLPDAWKAELFDYYLHCVNEIIPIDAASFKEGYAQLLLVRLLQVLGAYGLRGLIEKKPHFISSIPFGLENLASWMSLYACPDCPILLSIITQLSSPEFIKQFQMPNSPSNKPLRILVQSFSYKVGIPQDESGNGGGFVFDCRGILNPGRFEEYKKLTGRDQPVKDFLETKTKMYEFLQAVQSIISINIDDYLQRGFEHLQINFGCTGGQHRSVYSADAIAAFIEQKYQIKPTVIHIQQEAKGWVNE